MAGRTNYTAPTLGDEPNGPEQMTDIYRHFDPLIDASVPATGQLPSADNWPWREQFVESALRNYRWTGSGWLPAGGVDLFGLLEFSGERASGSTGGDAQSVRSYSSSPSGTGVDAGTNALTVRQTGWYEVSFTVNWASASGGRRESMVTVNQNEPGVPLRSVATASGAATAGGAYGLLRLTAGQIVRLRLFQDSGGPLSYAGRLTVKYLAPGAAAA